jgi:hypothetical protein
MPFPPYWLGDVLRGSSLHLNEVRGPTKYLPSEDMPRNYPWVIIVAVSLFLASVAVAAM